MSSRKYENFSKGMAWFDAVPVLLFSISMLLIAYRFCNPLFIAGAVICTCAGIGKVVWKIILASYKKDISIMNKQMRLFMPLGFVLMIAGVCTGVKGNMWSELWKSVSSLPAALFFAATIVGMSLMGVFAFKLDSTKARSNWIEQITNACAQCCLLIGVIICIG